MEYSSRFRIAQFGFGVAIIILMMLIGHQSGAQLTASTNPKAAFSAQGTFDQSDRAVSRVSLSEEERDEIAAIAKDIPAVDLDIPFDIDSAAVSETAKPSLDALGRALSSPDLRGNTFLIAGFTDGLESENYSQAGALTPLNASL